MRERERELLFFFDKFCVFFPCFCFGREEVEGEEEEEVSEKKRRENSLRRRARSLILQKKEK